MALAKKNERSLNQQIEWMLLQVKEGETAKPLLDELRALLESRKK